MCLSLRRLENPCLHAFRVLAALLSLTLISRAGDLTGIANLSWTPNPESNIAGYRVLHGTSSGALTQSQAIYGNIATATINGLETGRTHYFAVVAYNSSGLEGPLSDEVSFFVDAPSLPEISIERSPSTLLTDGQDIASLGEVKTGVASSPSQFIIRNTGRASLTGLVMEIDGADHPDFSISTSLPVIPILTANAGFNADFSAWTPSGNLRIIRDTTSSGSGNVVDFNFSNTAPNGALSQAFATVPGTTYTLSFDLGILSYNLSPQSIRATATGTATLLSQTASVTGTGNGGTRWESHRFTFVADSAVTRLTLTDVSAGTDGADLRLDNVRVTDAAAASAPGALTLEPGESSVFNVVFQPSSNGARNAYLHVFSNDADESPFDLTLTGTGTGVPGDPAPSPLPEIEVMRAIGTNLADGAASLTFEDTTLGSYAETETLVIRNIGSATLTGLSTFVDGAHADEFPTESLDVDSLAPGESTLVRVHFHPVSLGAKTATLQIFSNDADETSFEITLDGFGMPPSEIIAPEISVSTSHGINLVDRNFVGFDATLIGSSSDTEVLTIRNTGTANLEPIAITLDGAHASDFILTGTASSSLAPGASTTFNLTFRPTGSGVRNAAIRVASNDSDESTFDIPIGGNGVAVPEIAVERASGYSLADAVSTIEFTGIPVGSNSATEVLTLRNTGSAALTGIAATLSGPHASNFVITGPTATTLAPGATTTLSLAFIPTASGPRTAVLHIASNDADENPFKIALNGNGVATPDITVGSGGLFPGSPAAADLGSVKIGASSTARSFTLGNSGTAALTGLQFTLDGPHAGEFVIAQPATTSLAPGTDTAFSVTFRPTGSGSRTATLRIASNDPDTGSYAIVLTGTGIASPRLALFKSDGSPVASGSSIPFGSADLGAESPATFLTIRNTGTAVLTQLSAVISGTFGADFLVSPLDTTSLAPGASTSIRLSFSPLAAGTRSAVLQLAGSDPDSGPLQVFLTGTGYAYPVMTLADPDGNPLDPGSTLAEFHPVTVGAAGEPVTLRILNTGTAALPGLSIATTGPSGSHFAVTQPDFTSLEPGEETSFDIVFRPGSGGTKTAVLRISNTASPAAPFEIVVTGVAVTLPAIALADLEGNDLSSGLPIVNFGNADPAAVARVRSLTIRSTGTAALTGVRLLKEGSNTGDFIISGLVPDSIAPGAAVNFNIAFKPTAAGIRNASIRLTSNAGHDIILAVTGKGVTAPEIRIEAADKNLKAGESFINFGSSQTATRGETRTFTISNVGSDVLEKLTLAKNGVDSSDFIVTALKVTSLAPGRSTSFNVTFKPSATGIRWASIHVGSNDADERTFSIGLTGKGTNRPDTTKGVKSGRPRLSAPDSAVRAVPGIEVVNGVKYRALTVHQTQGTTVRPRDVEVSPNLTDWSSGPRHTTVVRNRGGILTVRDNTPLTPGTKRHIRLRP